MDGSSRRPESHGRCLIAASPIGRLGESEKAIADYSAVIEMAEAPADLKASALVNRGLTYRPSLVNLKRRSPTTQP